MKPNVDKHLKFQQKHDFKAYHSNGYNKYSNDNAHDVIFSISFETIKILRSSNNAVKIFSNLFKSKNAKNFNKFLLKKNTN